MAVLLTIILLAVKYRYAVIIGFSNLLASVFTQFLKHKVFVEELRPKKYFEGVQELYFVPGVENHLLHSFPSGHATSAFALYFSLALIVKGKMYNVLFFFIALLAAYSRVYLSQHFFEDIYIGSLIGVAFSLLVYWFMQKQDADWLEGSLIKAFEDQ